MLSFIFLAYLLLFLTNLTLIIVYACIFLNVCVHMKHIKYLFYENIME